MLAVDVIRWVGFGFTFLTALGAVLVVVYARSTHRETRIRTSREVFAAERKAINERRSTLSAALASGRYKDLCDGWLIVTPPWIVQHPIPAGDVTFAFVDAPQVQITGRGPEGRHVLPLRNPGERFLRYSMALDEIDTARPTLLTDDPIYRILRVDLAALQPRVEIGLSTYFEFLDWGEVLAHEFACRSRRKRTRLRRRIRFPTEFDTRPQLASINVLTLVQRESGFEFFLHDRSATGVAVAGGVWHVAPCGVIQPSTSAPNAVHSEATFLHTVLREYGEEFLGLENARGRLEAPFDFDGDRRLASLREAFLQRDAAQLWILGFGLDPLTLAGEFLAVACIKGDLFDEVFDHLITRTDEGMLLGSKMEGGHLRGFAFTSDVIETMLTDSRAAPPAIGCLTGAQAFLDHFRLSEIS